MYTLFIVTMTVLLTYIGLRLSKKNIDQELGKVTKFRLRYTFLILFIFGYTVYVDNLVGKEQREMIALTNEFIQITLHQLDGIFIDTYDWAIKNAQTIR
jgi:hypothetical protein